MLLATHYYVHSRALRPLTKHSPNRHLRIASRDGLHVRPRPVSAPMDMLK
jgi:hypothetical protein